MTDWLEEEEKAEKINNFHDRFQDVLISAGIIPTSPSDIFPPSPKSILQMKELTDNIQHLHITTPKTPKNSDTNRIKESRPPPDRPQNQPPPPQDMPPFTIFHRPTPPPPNPFECHLARKRQRQYSDRYERTLKIHWAKERFPNFLDSFSDKEWEDGIPTQTFRLRFINYFNFPISLKGIGQLKEVREHCVSKKKRYQNKIISIYKKR